MYQGYRVIDADAHFYEPANIWEQYVEAEYQDQIPRVAQIHSRAILEYEDGKVAVGPGPDDLHAHDPGEVRAGVRRVVEPGEPHPGHGRAGLGRAGVPGYQRRRVGRIRPRRHALRGHVPGVQHVGRRLLRRRSRAGQVRGHGAGPEPGRDGDGVPPRRGEAGRRLSLPAPGPH